MITHDGQQVFPKHSEHYVGQQPTLADIAVGLGRQSRFAGQTRVFYTVLCHTLVVADLVEPSYRLHALIHDAAEAIMGDVPTTWKPDVFKDLEQQIVEPLSRMLGLWVDRNDGWYPKAQDEVRHADYAALVAEAHVLGHAQAEKWWPRSAFDAQAERAVALTERQVNAGNQIRFLDPEAATNAYYDAVLRAVHGGQ